MDVGGVVGVFSTSVALSPNPPSCCCPLPRHPELVCALHASGSRVLLIDVEKVRCWHAVTAGETSSA